jgi:hypothetical protein
VGEQVGRIGLSVTVLSGKKDDLGGDITKIRCSDCGAAHKAQGKFRFRCAFSKKDGGGGKYQANR